MINKTVQEIAENRDNNKIIAEMLKDEIVRAMHNKRQPTAQQLLNEVTQ